MNRANDHLLPLSVFFSEVDAVGMVQCTCPTLHPEDLLRPCEMLRGGHDSVFAVTRVHRFRWKEVNQSKDQIVINSSFLSVSQGTVKSPCIPHPFYGSSPKGADVLCSHTWEIFSSSSFFFSLPLPLP